MTENQAVQYPPLIPYLFYDDVGAMLEFLSRAFGFAAGHTTQGPDGRIAHAEATLGGGMVMMGQASPQWGASSPGALPSRHCGIYVYVADVDAHFARAKAAGATIDEEPDDKPYGDRQYTTRDPEGGIWYFATRVRQAEP